MAEVSEKSPLLSDDSYTDVFLGREPTVQQFESTRTEINKDDPDSGRVDTVGGEVDIEETRNSADGDDRTELVGEAASNKIKLAEASKKGSQKPTEQKKLVIQPAGRAAMNGARAAAYDCRAAAYTCGHMMKVTRHVLSVCKARVNEAIAEATRAEEFDEATRYNALAHKYDDAIKLATTGTDKIEAAVDSAENASIEAEIAANEIADPALNETSGEQEKLSAAYCAMNTAKMAAIVTYRMEYVTLKAVRKCLRAIDPESLEMEYIRTPREEREISRKSQEMIVTFGFCAVSLIFGILILSEILSNGAVSPKSFISFAIIGSALVAIPVIYIIYKIYMYYENKRSEARKKINRHIITRIGNRLLELEEHFESNNISPVSSESENDVQ